VAVQTKVTCDSAPKGSEHSGPFFSLYVRVRQIGAGKTSPADRLRAVGVFCEKCLQAGKVALPADLACVSAVDGSEGAGTAREHCGSGSNATA
jgi:hypothetical protein